MQSPNKCYFIPYRCFLVLVLIMVGFILLGTMRLSETIVVNSNDTSTNIDRFVSSHWEERLSEELGRLVQRRIYYLQNPNNCTSARILICDLTFNAGYGSLLRHVITCLIAAYANNRTLVLEKRGWNYAKEEGWESVFQPLSKTCTSVDVLDSVPWQKEAANTSTRVVKMPHFTVLYRSKTKYRFLLPAIPTDLADRLESFHNDPLAWWTGQFAAYLTRPNKSLQKYIDTNVQKLGFKTPIVGIHVRRTDKLREDATYHLLEEYMLHVDTWYNTSVINANIDKRVVYLASDDVNILTEATKKYPNYMFINNFAAQKGTPRYSNLRGIILDTYLLSRCNYVVCTLSSNICRLVYEMQSLHGNASELVKSIDSIYCFAGDKSFTAKQNHTRGSIQGELEFLVGDTILWKRIPKGRYPEGFSKGTNVRTRKTGLFPVNKTSVLIERVAMPLYTNA